MGRPHQNLVQEDSFYEIIFKSYRRGIRFLYPSPVSHQMQPEIGGQAVIEGVLMRSPKKYAIAVRLPNKKIKVKKKRYIGLTKRYKILALPFVRGCISLFEMLILGMKALTWSANEQEEEHEKITTMQLTLSMLFAIAVTIVLFIALPLWLTKFLTTSKGFVFNLIDGIIRVVIFIIYILLISMMDDIKRVFQYHGAEHMTIHCLEAKKALTPKNVKKFTTLHPRCGTSFIIFVLVVAIIVFSFVTDPRWWVKLLSRIILIPVIAGISYEILKLSAKFKSNPICRILIYPGLMIQKITTKKPTKDQIEVAIASLKAVL